MSDIFSEVEEDLRRDQLKALWDRFGGYVIGVAIAVVAATAGNVLWTDFRQNQRLEAAATYSAALEAAQSGTQADLTALNTLAENGPTGYATLARFSLATQHLAAGDQAAAMAALDAIAADAGAERTMRDLARMKAVLIAIDVSSADEVEARLAPLLKEGNAFRPAALEAKAMNAMRAGKPEEARSIYTELAMDFTAPQGIRLRATAMLDVLGGALVPDVEDTATDAPAVEEEGAQ